MKLSLSHWYPWSGVVLDCIDFCSLPSFLLIHKGVLVLDDPWIYTVTTGMQNGDEGLPSINLAN